MLIFFTTHILITAIIIKEGEGKFENGMCSLSDLTNSTFSAK